MDKSPEFSSPPGPSTAGTVCPSPPSSSSRQGKRRTTTQPDSSEVKRMSVEVESAPAGSPPVPAPASQPELILPESWRKTLPPEQHEWLSKALFERNRTGRPVFRQDLQLWYHPPGPKLTYDQCPSNHNDFYQSPFFLWAPCNMWNCLLKCPDCGMKLTRCGIYKTVRKVLDISRWYHMGTEYLECSCCNRKLASWSQDVRKQLPLEHQLLFPAVMTYKLSCDKKLLVLMRGGNNVQRFHSKLLELHKTEWTERSLLFLRTCEKLRAPGGQVPPVPALPKLKSVPSSGWLMAIYARDASSRVHEMKAKVSSTFGSILKMTSTKKVARKLGGADAGAAQCMTTVGNELGQVLMSVLTETEGSGQKLEEMAMGLQQRYQRAVKDPPLVLYTDRHCCDLDGGTSAAALFPLWPQMSIRLDIRSFLLRLAAGVTSKDHALYPGFLQGLSGCVFKWDEEDLSRWSTTRQLEQSRSKRITEIKKMSPHCRRWTRGTQETQRLIDELLQTFKDATDSKGDPLLDWNRMKGIWSSERNHVACIQDPPGVKLYNQTGQITRAGVSIPVYRCARGSSSLQLFHSYIDRFIGGPNISGKYFQMYLLEGLTRWNEDRANGSRGGTGPRCYNMQLENALKDLRRQVYGDAQSEGAALLDHTGEMIGINYLYSQTGISLQDLPEEDPEVTSAGEEDEDVEEDELENLFLDPFQQVPPQELPSSQQTPPAQGAAEHHEGAAVSSSMVDPGFLHVVGLAQRLVRSCRGAHLPPTEVEDIVGLWEALPEADKTPLHYPPHHRMKDSSRKQSRRQTAACPDTSRLVEFIFIQLCVLHPSGMREDGASTSRWTLILRDYNTIRKVANNHQGLRARTGLQLFPVNRTTLCQWHQRFISAQERAAVAPETTHPPLPAPPSRSAEAPP